MRIQSVLRICCFVFLIAFLAVSCGRLDPEQEFHAVAALRLRESMVTIQTAVFLSEVSNVTQLVEYVNSFVDDTNYCAVQLRLMYSTIWVSTNFQDWTARVPDGRAVIVGKYEVNGRLYYRGRSLSATIGPIKYEAPPEAGFRAVVLQRRSKDEAADSRHNSKGTFSQARKQ